MDALVLVAAIVFVGVMTYGFFRPPLQQMGGGRMMSSLKWVLIAVALYFVISYFKNKV